MMPFSWRRQKQAGKHRKPFSLGSIWFGVVDTTNCAFNSWFPSPECITHTHPSPNCTKTASAFPQTPDHTSAHILPSLNNAGSFQTPANDKFRRFAFKFIPVNFWLWIIESQSVLNWFWVRSIMAKPYPQVEFKRACVHHVIHMQTRTHIKSQPSIGWDMCNREMTLWPHRSTKLESCPNRSPY